MPILCGVALIKIEKQETNDINRKQDFIALLDEVVEKSKFKLLLELKNWVTLTSSSLDDNVFFSIYNVANRHSALDIMDYLIRLLMGVCLVRAFIALKIMKVCLNWLFLLSI